MLRFVHFESSSVLHSERKLTPYEIFLCTFRFTRYKYIVIPKNSLKIIADTDYHDTWCQLTLGSTFYVYVTFRIVIHFQQRIHSFIHTYIQADISSSVY